MTKILNGFRNLAFISTTVLITVVILALDYQDAFDSCLVIYGVNTVVSLICAIMFTMWWKKKGSASSIYKWLTLLLFALALNDFTQMLARYQFVYQESSYTEFLRSHYWGYRSVPKMVALLYLLSFAIWQRFGASSTYHSDVRQDIAEGFEAMEARILEGEICFAGHSHEGLVLDARLIIKPSSKEVKES